MKTLLPFLLILAMFTTCPIVRADEAADKAQVRELEKNCSAALVKGDFDALKEIFAEDWVLVGPDGQLMSREQIF